MNNTIKALYPTIVEVDTRNGDVLKEYITNYDFSAAQLFANNLISHYESNKCEKIWLTGSPSMGKSTALNVLKISLIKCGIVYYYLNLRKLSCEYNTHMKEMRSALSNDVVKFIILDSYDEIEYLGKEEIKELNKLITTSVKTIVVASRCNSETENLFENFSRNELREFDERQQKEILSNILSLDIEAVPRNLLKIISNTMLLSLFIQIYKSAKVKKDFQKLNSILGLKYETELYFEYFKTMCFEKLSYSYAQEGYKKLAIEKVDHFLLDVGEYFYNSTFRKISSQPLPSICNEFDAIYKINNGTVESIHQEYIDFCISYYFARTISKTPSRAREILNGCFNNHNQRRSFRYAGQCLRFLNIALLPYIEISNGETTFRELNDNFPKRTSKEYAWLVHIWAGFCEDVLKNVKGIFDIGKPFVRIVKRFGFYGVNNLEIPLSPLNTGGKNHILWMCNGASYLCDDAYYSSDDGFSSSYQLERYLSDHNIKPKGYKKYRLCEMIIELIELGMFDEYRTGIKEHLIGAAMYILMLGLPMFGAIALSSTYFVLFTDNSWETFIWWQYGICLLTCILISLSLMFVIGCVIYRAISKTKIRFIKRLQSYLYNCFKIDMEIKASGSAFDFDFRYRINDS